MRVLVGCEFSGTVREAFRRKGHNAWSCDLLPAEDGSLFHLQCDVLDVLDGLPVEPSPLDPVRKVPWDLAIFHPPCTHLAVSGAKWFARKRADGSQQAALDFVRRLLDAPIPRIALENPVSIISSAIRKPDQIIQPWMFGHPETKATCLWLKNLPILSATDVVSGREQRVWRMPPSPNRWKERSRTFKGIAEAMADQWGILKPGPVPFAHLPAMRS